MIKDSTDTFIHNDTLLSQQDNPQYHKKTFFGRRKGKGMSQAKEDLLATHLSDYSITLPTAPSEKLDFTKFFDFKPDSFVFEIGYGTGEHLVQMALANPNTAFIGTEVFLNGNASILKKIIDNNIKNIRIFPDDANLLFPHIPNDIFKTIFVLYPDPWPKNRNEARRMINENNIQLFHRWLSVDGNLFVASDHPVYIPWVLMVLHTQLGQSLFRWTATTSSDFTNPPKDWFTTRYEQKAIAENRKPIYLNFLKK